MPINLVHSVHSVDPVALGVATIFSALLLSAAFYVFWRRK